MSDAHKWGIDGVLAHGKIYERKIDIGVLVMMGLKVPRVIRRIRGTRPIPYPPSCRYEKLGNLGVLPILVLQLARNPTISIPGHMKLPLISKQLKKTETKRMIPSESFVSG